MEDLKTEEPIIVTKESPKLVAIRVEEASFANKEPTLASSSHFSTNQTP